MFGAAEGAFFMSGVRAGQSTICWTSCRSSCAVRSGEVRRAGAGPRFAGDRRWPDSRLWLIEAVYGVFKFGVMVILGAVVAPISGIVTRTRQTQSARRL